MFPLNAGYFLMQDTSERDREEVYKLSATTVARMPMAWRRSALSGSSIHTTAGSTPQDLATVGAASKHIPKERLGSTDDCGFSPFSIDVKPLHGSPDFARDVAFQKIASRVQGSKMAAEKLGIHVPAMA